MNLIANNYEMNNVVNFIGDDRSYGLSDLLPDGNGNVYSDLAPGGNDPNYEELTM